MLEVQNQIYLSDQVRALDRIAIEEFSISGFTLMQRAADAAFSELRQSWPNSKSIIVLAGVGNNGGDGYLIAALVHDLAQDMAHDSAHVSARTEHIKVKVIQCGDHKTLTGDAKKAHDIYVENGGLCVAFDINEFTECDIIVDALLGTGLKRPVTGDYASAIELVNDLTNDLGNDKHVVHVLSVDIPSGLDANSGCPLGMAIKADVTVTFVAMKLGLLMAAGREYSGRIVFNHLKIPKEVYQSMSATCHSIQLNDLHAVLGKRHADAHKGSFGHVLCIGGSAGMAGSVMLAAEAAARTGSGLVSVATLPEQAATAVHFCREIMVHGVNSVKELNPLLKQASVIVIGPGLGQDAWAKELLSRVLEFDLPMVVDADALNLIASEPTKKETWVITPHPGEAARLLKCSTKDIQQDRLQSVQNLQKQYGGVAVLKGSGTLVTCGTTSESSTSICTAGNPGMATGGMGDVLTGIIAGLMAQGLTIYDAARFGVQLHAQSADIAAEDGTRGMLASDLFVPLRKLVNF